MKIEQNWAQLLQDKIQTPSIQKLKEFLLQERKTKTIYPAEENVFAAFRYSPPKETKVVILGQDPYHGPMQAHGLSFSVPKGVAPPPSLKNIFKELQSDLGISAPSHGCLEGWAKQGVLLLNSVLTVRDNEAGAHRNIGWEAFTDGVLETLASRDQPCVFVLWGRWAREKKETALKNRKACHLVLEAPHPSPLSAHAGFFGTKPFSKINNFLKSQNQKEIDWSFLP